MLSIFIKERSQAFTRAHRSVLVDGRGLACRQQECCGTTFRRDFLFHSSFSLQTQSAEMGTIFEDFSPELVQAVIELVEPSSWKVLRLVSRTLAAYVTPLLFRDVEAWIQMQSLQK